MSSLYVGNCSIGIPLRILGNINNATAHGSGPVISTGAPNNKLATIFSSTKNDFITGFAFRVTARLGATIFDCKLSLQGVDNTGNPNGIIKGGASPVSVQFPVNPSTPAPYVIEKTFNNSYSSYLNESLSIVLEYISGGSGSSITTSISLRDRCFYDYNSAYSTSWTKNSSLRPLVCNVKYLSGYASKYNSANSTSNSGNITFGTGNSIKKVGNVFIPRENCIAKGVSLLVNYPEINSKISYKILDDSYNTLVSVDHYGAVHYHAANTAAAYRVTVLPHEMIELKKGRKYFCIAEGVESNSLITTYYTYLNTEFKDLHGGNNFYLVTNDGSSWTEDVLSVVQLNPIISNFERAEYGGVS